MNSIRTLLAMCCQKGLYIMQYDVETAFLNGKLEEEIYMQPPEGYASRKGEVCKLNRSL